MQIDPEERKILERLAGRELTDRDLQLGGRNLRHPETRSDRELLEKTATVVSSSEPPANGWKVAAARAKQKDESNLPFREQVDREVARQVVKRDAELKSAQDRQKIASDPKVIEATKLAETVARRVRFTDGATVEHLERADAMVELAKSGDLDAFNEAHGELMANIRETVFQQPLQDIEAEYNAIRARSSVFAPPALPEVKPMPDDRGFTLADLQRSAELKRQAAETQPVESDPAESKTPNAADEDWGIDAAFDELIAQVRALPAWDEPKGGDADG